MCDIDLTIIKSVRMLSSYPFIRLDGAFRDAYMMHAQQTGDTTAILMLFECYCDLTQNNITYTSLSSPSFNGIVQGFLGALDSEDIIAGSYSTRTHKARRFIQILSKIRSDIPALELPVWSTELPANCRPVWDALLPELNEDAKKYWSCWPVKGTNSASMQTAFHLVWRSHGATFAIEIYDAIRLYLETKAREDLSALNAMLKFLSERSDQYPSDAFKDPVKIHRFFEEYCNAWFLDGHEKQFVIKHQINRWGYLIKIVMSALIEKGKWAMPFTMSLPKPSVKSVKGGAHTHIKKTENGTEVHQKLITDIPLQITDTEAIELLLNDIERDINIVAEWAKSEKSRLWNSYQKRKILADMGTYIKDGCSAKSIEQIGLDNICTTFERDGFKSPYRSLVRKFGNNNGVILAKELGLPTSDSIDCYRFLLIVEHPKIQPNFLQDLCLFNKNGQQTGFRSNGDAECVLDGNKRRRGPRLAQLVVDLNPISKRLVEEVIELTTPLREYLKSINDDNWRKLFLTCGYAFSRPKPVRGISWHLKVLNEPHKTQLVDGFERILNKDRMTDDQLSRDEVIGFMSRVSLGTLRASCGVKIYLETKSVEKMAKALGHAKYDANLLSHYLPDAILAFFQTRWIRIFQKGLICEAMKDSPYLLRAANFESMEELHEFLSNHGLKDIPGHLDNPKNEPDKVENSHVVIKIDTGILTALLSIEQAVQNAFDQSAVSGMARYWCDVSKTLTHEIQQSGKPLLVEHLQRALEFAEPQRMEKIIYAHS